MADEHREDATKTYRTKTGKELSDTDVEALADEVERDYGVEPLKTRRRGRRRWDRRRPKSCPCDSTPS